MPRTKLRQGQTQTSKEEGGSTARTTAQIEKYYSGGKREFTYKKNDRGKVIKVELKGGGMGLQDESKVKPGKVDAKDFAVLRKEKAKGRGMGLQDESVKPGKVMKANLGLMFMKKAKDKGAKGAEFLSPIAMAKRMFNKKAGGVIKAKRGKIDGYLSTFDASAEASTPRSQRGVTTIVGVKPGSKIGKGKKKFKSMEEMRKAKGFKTIDGKQETSSEFNKRRMALAAAKKTASASRIGKIALGIGTAGVAASQYLKSKMNKKKDVKKKMGGGMMKKYSVGGGADSGKVGEMKSRIAVTIDRLKKAHKNTMGRRSGPMGNRLTDNDMEKIKNLVGKNKAARPIQKKMGGGMMKKPMGYKDGTKPGAGPLGGAGRAAGLGALGVAAAGKYKHEPHNMSFPGDFKNFSESSQLKEAREKADSKYKKDKQHPVKGKHASFDRLVNSGKVEQSAFKKYRKDTASNRESGRKMGGMMKPSGYRTGTMVKARGCKLGRTRPTKIT